VTVVTTSTDGVPHGITVSAFMSVSLEPPLVAVSIEKRARSHSLVAAAGRFGVSILSDAQEATSRFFAGLTRAGFDPAYTWHLETPLIADALGHLVCRVSAAHDAGDHTIYVGAVEYLGYRQTARPLLYFRGAYAAVAERTADTHRTDVGP
jgi:flavin reductase (DIM6/NTAB) family NADH-FMN oxidoreductase RutF